MESTGKLNPYSVTKQTLTDIRKDIHILFSTGCRTQGILHARQMLLPTELYFPAC